LRLDFASLGFDLPTGFTDGNQRFIHNGDVFAGIFRHKLAEVFHNPEVIFIHDYFPLPAKAHASFYYRPSAVFKQVEVIFPCRSYFVERRSMNSLPDNRKSKTSPEPFDAAQDKLRRRIQNRTLAGIVALAATFALCGAAAQAQQATKIPRIGYLGGGSASAVSARHEAFRQGLRDLGYVEGKNIAIEWRSWEGKRDRQRPLVAELVRLKVDVIVAVGSGDIRAAKEATATIPIVMINPGDPVGSGLVASIFDCRFSILD